MFCSACGTKSPPGLKYCKNCGAKMVGARSDISEQVAKTFSLATVFIGAFGVIGFVIMIKSLLENGAQHSFILLMSVLYLGTLVGLAYMLIRNVLKMIGFAETRSQPEGGEEVPAFKPAITKQLDEHREPAASVVENTTRNLSAVPRGESDPT